MKKLYIGILIIVSTLVIMLCITSGNPIRKDYAQNIAKKSVQSKTFQIHEVRRTTYNIFTNKYIVKLFNTTTKEFTTVYVTFDDEGMDVTNIEWDYQGKIS